MSYLIVLPRKAQKDLAAIDSGYQRRITVALITLAADPYRGKKLGGERVGERSYRVWPYRIIYRIKNTERVVLIIRISDRQGSYG